MVLPACAGSHPLGYEEVRGLKPYYPTPSLREFRVLTYPDVRYCDGKKANEELTQVAAYALGIRYRVLT
eukprot:1001212-Rhodomonas_salina.2